MKRLGVLFAILSVCSLCQAGVSFVGVDGVATTYTAGTGTLTMDDSAVITIEYDDNSQTTIDPGSLSLETYYDSGMLFTGGTFVYTDESGPSVVLSGNVLSVQFEEALGYLVGNGTAEVLVSNLTGFPLGDAQLVSITFNLDPAFVDFDQDYTGDSKVNLVVPEPATMGLLGFGGLALLRRKK